jgi:hypothetical protein
LLNSAIQSAYVRATGGHTVTDRDGESLNTFTTIFYHALSQGNVTQKTKKISAYATKFRKRYCKDEEVTG